MEYRYRKITEKSYRLIPSRFPPISLFDWADSTQELEQLAKLEGLTNDRLKAEYGKIRAVPQEDWVSGNGATIIMSPFTHIGYGSRFSEGQFGVYYAANSLETAVAETVYHRTRFLNASEEPSCLIQMREYLARIMEPLVDIFHKQYKDLLNPDPNGYFNSQKFGLKLREAREWGIVYPSVRREKGTCFGILRPSALAKLTQGRHLDYIWDGKTIEVRLSKILNT